jgi:hypothetical protein
MKNSKMLLLATITMLSSISIIKSMGNEIKTALIGEYIECVVKNMPEDIQDRVIDETMIRMRRDLIKQLAQHAFNSTVNNCTEYSRDQNNICTENLNLFFDSIQHIPFIELKSVFNECDKEITKKNQQIDCYNCKNLAEDFKYLKLSCLDEATTQIKIGNGKLTKEQFILEEKQESLRKIALEKLYNMHPEYNK